MEIITAVVGLIAAELVITAAIAGIIIADIANLTIIQAIVPDIHNRIIRNRIILRRGAH